MGIAKTNALDLNTKIKFDPSAHALYIQRKSVPFFLIKKTFLL